MEKLFTVRNACQLLVTADAHHAHGLKHKAMDFIREHSGNAKIAHHVKQLHHDLLVELVIAKGGSKKNETGTVAAGGQPQIPLVGGRGSGAGLFIRPPMMGLR